MYKPQDGGGGGCTPTCHRTGLQILVVDVALLFDSRSLRGGCNTTAVTLQG